MVPDVKPRSAPLTNRPCHWPEYGGGNVTYHMDRESRKIPQTPRPKGWPKYEGDEDEQRDTAKPQDAPTVTEEKKVSFWQRLKRSVRRKGKEDKEHNKSKPQAEVEISDRDGEKSMVTALDTTSEHSGWDAVYENILQGNPGFRDEDMHL